MFESDVEQIKGYGKLTQNTENFWTNTEKNFGSSDISASDSHQSGMPQWCPLQSMYMYLYNPSNCIYIQGEYFSVHFNAVQIQYYFHVCYVHDNCWCCTNIFLSTFFYLKVFLYLITPLKCLFLMLIISHAVSFASCTYELSEGTHVTPFHMYTFHSTGLCSYKP